MGRKTLFLEEWGDQMFKAAYSCIPQGTVGDIINERGLNYIYYNQKEFRPVELLMQVHDSINFQIPLSIPWKEHYKMLIKIKTSLETPLKTEDDITFSIPADIKVGLNFGPDMREISRDFSAGILEEAYECLVS